MSREEALRRELHEAREAWSALESGATASAAGDTGAAAVLAQLAQLQRAALGREQAHAHALRHRAAQLG